MGPLTVSQADSTVPLDVRAALTLTRVPRLGPRRTRLLIDHFGSASRALAACRRGEAGAAFGGETSAALLSPALSERLTRLAPVSERTLGELGERRIQVLVYGSSAYPSRLSHLHDPPTVLFVRGQLPLLKASGVAIVGTRRATAYGRRMARDIAQGVARRGRTVISGMARGIDGAAHRAALDAGGGSIGVLGCGLDRVYPVEHRDLYARMRREGLLVSEFSPGRAPKPGFFPRRNRVIAALAQAVVVVQAGQRSGALITVGHALDIGRDVFAVPGPVGPPASEGVHRLLKDGAILATGVRDLASGLGWGEDALTPDPAGSVRSGIAKRLPDWSVRILERLREGPANPDELARVGGRSTADTLSLLGRWEIEGRVRRQTGGNFELPPASQGRRSTDRSRVVKPDITCD